MEEAKCPETPALCSQHKCDCTRDTGPPLGSVPMSVHHHWYLNLAKQTLWHGRNSGQGAPPDRQEAGSWTPIKPPRYQDGIGWDQSPDRAWEGW